MTTTTIIIKDAGDSIEVEGHLDPANAVDLPPTPAVIIGSYLAANMGQVAKDAIAWMTSQTVAPAEPGVPSSLLVDGGQG